MTIRLSDVHFTYAAGTPWARPVLKGIDLEVPAGECLGILGGNGSGKTTLVRHMNGLLLPQRGTVQVGEVTLTPETKPSRLLSDETGLVFQFPEKQLFAETVGEDVAFGLEFAGAPPGEIPSRVDDALRQVGLDPGTYRRRSPFSLNWGEKRQAAIAGVLALDTPRLVFDEPGAGLDPAGRRRITGLMRELAGRGKTVIVVSHHLDDIFRIADRLVVLGDGRVVFHGSLEELCRHDDLDRWGLQWPPLIGAVKAVAARHPGLETAVRTPEEAAAVLRPLLPR